MVQLSTPYTDPDPQTPTPPKKISNAARQEQECKPYVAILCSRNARTDNVMLFRYVIFKPIKISNAVRSAISATAWLLVISC